MEFRFIWIQSRGVFFLSVMLFHLNFFKAQIDETWPRFMTWSVKFLLLKKSNFPFMWKGHLMAWGFVQILCPCTACWKTRTGFNTCTCYLTLSWSSYFHSSSALFIRAFAHKFSQVHLILGFNMLSVALFVLRWAFYKAGKLRQVTLLFFSVLLLCVPQG